MTRRKLTGMGRTVPEDLYTPASDEGEEAGRQVPGWVDGISCVHAQGHSNYEDEDANHQCLCPLQCWVVPLVRDSEETQLEHPRH